MNREELIAGIRHGDMTSMKRLTMDLQKLIEDLNHVVNAIPHLFDLPHKTNVIVVSGESVSAVLAPGSLKVVLFSYTRHRTIEGTPCYRMHNSDLTKVAGFSFTTPSFTLCYHEVSECCECVGGIFLAPDAFSLP
ncbi:uncharacterized protein LOC135820819 [Sycon ciliatum]|uniref:uncharacterized protein LOC135820819 n=1 Tax=Sycon ciliatum TaxID=27933 RepID=UPI0031F6BBB7